MESSYFHDLGVLRRVRKKYAWKEVIGDKMTRVGHLATFSFRATVSSALVMSSCLSRVGVRSVATEREVSMDHPAATGIPKAVALPTLSLSYLI